MATDIHIATKRDPLGELRHDRDRFVAFAFSASDVLFELDGERKILFAAGAAGALLGIDPASLRGRPFAEIIAATDRAMIEEALINAGSGHRVNGLVCRFEGESGLTPPLTLLGYQVPDLDGHYFLGLRLGVNEVAKRAAAPDPETLGESGLPRGDDFAQMAGQRLAQLAEGQGCEMTMLRLGDMGPLRERLDEENREAMALAIGGALRANALGGDLAGEIDEGNYGLLHRHDTDVAALGQRIAEITREADPEKKGVDVVTWTLAIDPHEGGVEQTSRALNYIFAQFADSHPDEFSIASLSQGMRAMAENAKRRVDEFEAVLRDGAFEIAFQPVVELASQRPHHFEALVRFSHLPPGTSPYETITFAEQSGMIADFDLAMCTRVLEWLDEAGRQGQRYKVAVNLSGTSIASKTFVLELHKLLKQYRGLKDSLIFEITESAKIKNLAEVNTTLQTLRRAGHKVCLDDFGAGAAAFQYLRDLDVDVVKIDGAYVRGALKSEKGMAFLRAMAGLCNDLGVTTVAEMVEDQKTLNFLRDCGIGFGQGYLFGKPSLHISSFDAPRPSNFATGKKGASQGRKP